MSQPRLNPFIYPGPVPAKSFFGREEAIHSLLSRIATGQNTAVVGEPNIGKSSLLKHLVECEDCHTRLDSKASGSSLSVRIAVFCPAVAGFGTSEWR